MSMRHSFADDIALAGFPFHPETVVFEAGGMQAFNNAYEGYATTIPDRRALTQPFFDYMVVCWNLEVDDNKGHYKLATYFEVMPDEPHYNGKRWMCTLLALKDGDWIACSPRIISFLFDDHPDGYGHCYHEDTFEYNGTDFGEKVMPYLADLQEAITLTEFPLAFMQAVHKQVDLELVTMPRNYSRRMKRKTGKAPSPYFSIGIQVNKSRKKYTRNRNKGLSKSNRQAHIVRGHFVRYTPDNPLFGKYTGTYWRSSHVRSLNKADQPVKARDYRIILPLKPENTNV